MNNTTTTLTAQVMTTKSGRQTHIATTGSSISACGVRVTVAAEHGAAVTCGRCAQTWAIDHGFENEIEVIETTVVEVVEVVETTSQPLTWAQARAMKAAQ